MGDFTFFQSIKLWIGDLGFRIFLWSISMTQNEYLNAVCEDDDDKERRK